MRIGVSHHKKLAVFGSDADTHNYLHALQVLKLLALLCLKVEPLPSTELANRSASRLSGVDGLLAGLA